MEMIVKDTADGNCIYCPKCVERHKFLDREAERLIKCYGLSINTREEPKQFNKKSRD
jgi:hypothetical protein